LLALSVCNGKKEVLQHNGSSKPIIGMNFVALQGRYMKTGNNKNIAYKNKSGGLS